MSAVSFGIVRYSTTYQNILCLSRGCVFKVQAYQVLGEPAVKGIIHLIEDEIQKVESRDESWWEVVFGANSVGCCKN